MPRLSASLFDALGPWAELRQVAIGFSGGADSVFLALAWQAFLEAQGLDGTIRTALWVVDHEHVEGSAARASSAAALGETLGIGLVRVLRPSELAETPPAGGGEESLRRARYACFAAAAAEAGTEVLLLGHQADDQAETVLMRILRGTGMFGLAGIPARRLMSHPDGKGHTEVRRPLLPLRRTEIRDRLREAGQVWIRDPSNADPLYATRNGLRLQALPMLGEWATGDPVRALVRLQREAEDWKRSEVHGVIELVQSGDWLDAAGPQRRRAIELVLRRAGYARPPARVQDLEGALLRRGSANLNETHRLTIAGGPLRLVPRRDAPVQDEERSV